MPAASRSACWTDQGVGAEGEGVVRVHGGQHGDRHRQDIAGLDDSIRDKKKQSDNLKHTMSESCTGRTCSSSIFR